MSQINLLDSALNEIYDNDIVMYCLGRYVGDVSQTLIYVAGVDIDNMEWLWAYDSDNAFIFYTADAASKYRMKNITQYRKDIDVHIIEVTVGTDNQITERVIEEK